MSSSRASQPLSDQSVRGLTDAEQPAGGEAAPGAGRAAPSAGRAAPGAGKSASGAGKAASGAGKSPSGAAFRRWVGKGSWAVADQLLYGGGNFVLTVLLARWLTEAGYGAYAVALSVFVFVMAFHGALISEPLLVFGSGRFGDRFREYVSVLLDAHSAFAALSSALFLIGALVIARSGSAPLSGALLGLAIASPFMLFSHLMRRACYVHHQPHLAATGGAVYMVVALAGAYLLYANQLLSAARVFMVMGGAGLVAGLVLAWHLGLSWKPLKRNAFSKEVLREHWQYGRWAAAARLPMRVSSSAIMMVLPIWAGLAAAGGFQASLNLIMPVTQINGALGLLLIPTLARVKGRPEFFTTTRRMLLLFGASAGLYWLMMGLLGGPVMAWLYDGRYDDHASLLWILGALPVLAGLIEVMSSALRANERPDRIFWCYAAAATIGLPIALLLVGLRGLSGAAVGTVLVSAVTATAMAVVFQGLRREQPRAAHEAPA